MLGGKLEPTLSHGCQKGQWLPALVLLCQMLEVRLEPIIRCSIRTSAREKGQWQPTQPLLCEILRAKGQSQLALASL